MKEEFKNEKVRQIKKGQAAIEFLAFLILIMIVSVAVYAGAFGKLSDAASSERRFELQSACRSIANTVNQAQTFGNGFSSNITLPEGSISMLNNTAVCAGGNDVFMEAVIGNVRNSTGGASFNLGKHVKIENSLGTVIIS